MSGRVKLGAPIGLRLHPAVERKLNDHAKERVEEPLEIIRRGVVTELERLDAMIPDATRAKLNKLRDAGLDFDAVVADALARKAEEDRQLRMESIIPPVAAPANRPREAASVDA